MKSAIILLLLTAAILNCTACATSTYHDRFSRVSSERNEFQNFDEKYKVFKGKLSPDEILRDNKKYYTLQFKDILPGDGRFLNILIPQQYGTDPLLFESSEEIKNGKTAYLFFVRMCCTDEYREIFDPVTSRDIEKDRAMMNKIIRDKFPESAGTDSPVIFCQLSFTNVNYYDLAYKIWRPYSNTAPFSDSGYYMDAPYSSIDVKWRERSRLKSGMVKAGYIFPVLFDIVTSPVQLIGVVIYFAAGGAVK